MPVVLDTFCLGFKEVTRTEFKDLSSSWYKDMRFAEGLVRARITVPMMYLSYRRLLSEFKDTRYASRISYISEGHWRDIDLANVRELKVSELVPRLQASGKHKGPPTGNLELYLAKPPELPAHYPKRAVLRFTEYEGRIVNFDVEIPRCMRDQFSLEDISPGDVRAIWVP